MRILRLDLKAFGPFTNVTLSPHAGQYGLHIVYGPNEAGKSSSLRALRQWLFGIEQQTADNFLHPYPDLRIGGVIEDGDGNRLEFIRRKARLKSLRDAKDEDLVDEAVLDRMLGGIDDSTFSRRFGINYEELRRGGHLVAQGEGELGELLFAAGAGVADLGRLQKQLRDEADALFTPRGTTKKTLNAAMARYKEATQQVKERQVSSTAWKQLDQALRKAEQQRSEIESVLEKLRRKLHRLERVESALPLIGKRQDLQERLQSVQDAPLLPDDFAEQRSKLTESLRHQDASHKTTEQEIQKLTTALAEIHLPAAVLDNRDRIVQIKDDLGAYRKAQKDLPGLATRVRSAEERALAILSELEKPQDLKVAEGLKVSKVHRQQIRGLASQYQAVKKEQENADQRRSRLRRDLTTLETALARSQPPADSAELRRAVRDVTQEGNLDERLAALLASRTHEEENAQLQLDKLPLWEGSLDELERLPVPQAETLDQYEQSERDLRSALTQTQTERERLLTELEKLTTEQQSLQLEQAVPSEHDLTLLRQRRDEGWQIIARLLQGEEQDNLPEAAAYVTEFSPGGSFAEAYRASVLKADELSDRLRREADRVFRSAQIQADIDSTQRKLKLQSEACSKAEEALDQHQQEWQELWRPTGVSPRTPREMRGWLRSQQELVAVSGELRNSRQAAEAVRNQILRCRTLLQEALVKVGLQPDDGDQRLTPLVIFATDSAEKLDAAVREHIELGKESDRLTRELAEADHAVTVAESALATWQHEWDEAVSELGIAAAGEPDATNVILQQIEDLQQELREKNSLTERINDIQRESRAFESQIEELLQDVAPELTDWTVDRAVQELSNRLETGTGDLVRKDALRKQLDDAVQRQAAAVGQREILVGQLGELCSLAGVSEVSELADAERRAAERKQLDSEIDVIETRLIDLAGGVPLDEFRASMEGLNIDDVRAEKVRLQTTIQDRESERTQIVESIGENRNELHHMDGRADAAVAQEQAELIAAETRDAAEQYIRLHLASVVLKQAIDRYREASQGPVLDHASQLFARLTLNSFSGLRAEYTDKGEAVIAGVRGNGQRVVHVDGMSEGTCDQLYLALRLALLEATLESGRRMPFILDDVLIMFDDSRTAAALKVLADLSARTQVIYFTHHDHLLELARTHVDNERLFLHTLTGNGQSTD